MGPPLRTAEFDIYFEKGVDDFGGWLHVMKNHNLVKQGGSWYTYTDENGKDYKFMSKDFEKLLLGNLELKEEIYSKICDNYIMKYKPENLGIDDIEIGNDDVPTG